MALVIDPQVAGIAGDMFLCALVDMGADRDAVTRGMVKAASVRGDVTVRSAQFSKVTRRGVSATALLLDIREEASGRTGLELRSWMADAAEALGLSDAAKRFAAASVDSMIAAESRIHGCGPDEVRLHEAAGADTVIDIIGSAVAMESLRLYGDEAFCCPVAVGGGTVSFSHGTMSNPGTAILEILKGSGIAIAGGQAGAELTTPTGASILAGLKPEYSEYYPMIRVDRIGYGAGSRDFDGFANVLRLVAGRGADGRGMDSVHILETSLDDVTGELLGIAVDRLMEAGAHDVSVVPGLTKKGRPNSTLSVICDHSSADRLLDVLMSETGTLGVRVRTSRRVTAARLPRTTRVRLDGRDFEVRYQWNVVTGRFKIESDDIRRVSSAVGRPFALTEELIRAQVSGSSDDSA